MENNINTNPIHISNRERQVLECIAEGLTSRQISAELGISVGTVESHRKTLFAKLHVNNMASLVHRSYQIGIMRVSDQEEKDYRIKIYSED